MTSEQKAESEVTYNGYAFVKKPVLKTVVAGKAKVQIGFVVVPMLAKDLPLGDLLTEMVDAGVFTNKQVAKAVFGQGFDLESRKRLASIFNAATKLDYDRKAAETEYSKAAMEQEACKALLLPTEKLNYIVQYCRHAWLEHNTSNNNAVANWDCNTTINCWDL